MFNALSVGVQSKRFLLLQIFRLNNSHLLLCSPPLQTSTCCTVLCFLSVYQGFHYPVCDQMVLSTTKMQLKGPDINFSHFHPWTQHTNIVDSHVVKEVNNETECKDEGGEADASRSCQKEIH